MTPARPGRPAVVTVAAAVGSALLLGGCSFTSRDVVLEPYAPADGVQTELGDVLVRNVLVVSEGAGSEGLLVAALANRGDEVATVVVEVGGQVAGEVEVPVNGTLQLGPTSTTGGTGAGAREVGTVVVDQVEAAAGDVVEVRFSDATTGTVSLQAPVLLPSGYYEGFTP